MDEENQKLNKRKQELKKAIEITEKNKKNIIKLVQNLTFRLNSRVINRKEYDEELANALGNRNSEQWIKYYDDYLDYYNYQIKLCDKLIKEKNIGKIRNGINFGLKALVIFAVIGILISLFFVLKPVFEISKKGLEKIPEKAELAQIPPAVNGMSPEEIASSVSEETEEKASSVSEETEEIDLFNSPVVTIDDSINFDTNIEQGAAVIGEPVEWNFEVNLEDPNSFEVNLPEGADYILVNENQNGVEQDVTSNVEINSQKPFLFFGKETTTINIPQSSENYIIKYETPAPEIKEEEIPLGKRVIISGPDNLHYRNILTYSELPKEINPSEVSKIKIYQIKNIEGNLFREPVVFSTIDSNEDGLLDSLEWITPSLSEAVFEIIIEISKAQHLDANKNFVSDIYEQVKEQDGIWSEQILNGDFVRVTFKQLLTKENDITIYPRIINGNPKIEVYEIKGNKIIAEFSSLQSNEYNKIYLTNLISNSQDVFDLKIIDGSIEFDYIVDPIVCSGTSAYQTLSGETCSLGSGDWESPGSDGCSAASDGNLVNQWEAATDNAAPHPTVYGDLGSQKCISEISVDICPSNQPNAWFNDNINVDVSDDANTWRNIIGSWNINENPTVSCSLYTRTITETQARYVRVTIPYAQSTVSSIGDVQVSTRGACNQEDDANFCLRLGKVCGSVTADDNCGISRTVNCGSCGSGFNCVNGVCESIAGGSDDYPQIYFTNPTPWNNVVRPPSSVIINVSISEENLREVKYNWNGTNFTIYNDSLILMYNFDNRSGLGESATLVKDISKYGNDITLSGAVINSSSGKYGFGAYFDGSNDYMLSATFNNPPQSYLSICAWIKTNTVSRYIVQNNRNPSNINNEYVFQLNSAGRLLFWDYSTAYGFSNSAGYSTNVVTNNNWHYVCFVKNSLSGTYYIDGIANGVKTAARNVLYGNSDFVIGRDYRASSYFRGLIDEFKIWNRSLSSAEIYQQYVSNLNKYNSTQWYLYVNQSKNSTTDLSVGNYNYQACAKDLGERENCTETRNLLISNEINYNIDDCIILDQPNSQHNMTQNIIRNDLVNDCIKIIAENITFDCKGFYIKSNNNFNGIFSNQSNTTVKNCNVSMGELAHSIRLDYANNSYIYNFSSSVSNGIQIYYTYNSKLENISILTSSTNGIFLSSSINNSLININSNANNSNALIFLQGSDNNTIKNINCYNVTRCIGLRSSSFNNISEINSSYTYLESIHIQMGGNNTIQNFVSKNDAYGFYFFNGGSDNIIKNCNISDSTFREINSSRSSINNILLNCSYDILKEYVDSTSQLIRKWYYRAYVNDSQGLSISGANVSAYDSSDDYQFSILTNPNGFTNITIITDYINAGGVRIFYSDYIINATNGSLRDEHLYNVTNITNNLKDVFTFGGDNLAPQVNFTNPTPSNNTIATNTSVAINVSISEENLREVEYNWNGTNFTIYNDSLVLMYNFDYRGELGEQSDFIRDLSRYGNDGYAFNGASWTSTGKYNGAFGFDGNDYIDSGKVFASDSSPVTMSAWIKTTSSGKQVIVERGGSAVGFGIYISNSNASFVYDGGSTYILTDTINISDGNWHFIAGSAKTGDIRLYVDGISVKNRSGTLMGSEPVQPLTIGGIGASTPNSGAGYFNGVIDEVKVWNRSLSAYEIYQQYVSNLNKYNSTQWYLYVNQSKNATTGLDVGDYSYSACAKDNLGMGNCTETRFVNVKGDIRLKIYYVEPVPDVSVEPEGERIVYINFSVYDENGYNDINSETAKINVTLGSVVKQNLTCEFISGSGNYANYSCNISMRFFDNPGDWNINVSIKDNSGNSAFNDSTTFYYRYFPAWDIAPSYINWNNVQLGILNQESDNDLIIINQGNANITEVTVNASNLQGETYLSDIIPAENFASGKNNGCNGIDLILDEKVSIMFDVNYTQSTELNPASENLGFCLKTLENVQLQTYNSIRNWEIDVIFAFAAVSFGNRRKRKLKNRNLKNSSKNQNYEEKYEESELLKLVEKKIKEKFGISINEFISEDKRIKEYKGKLNTLNIEIPISIFKEEAGPAEILCAYLHEHLNLKFSEISKLINRNQRTVWMNYHNSKKSKKEKFIVEEKSIKIPLNLFSDRRLSVLESVVRYLREKGLKNKEIADLLNQDQRVIGTLYSRVNKKIK